MADSYFKIIILHHSLHRNMFGYQTPKEQVQVLPVFWQKYLSLFFVEPVLLSPKQNKSSPICISSSNTQAVQEQK